MPLQNVILIDSGVVDYQTIVSYLPPSSEWFLLDPSKDGITQIASTVARYSNLASIQIVSHGTQASLQLGNMVLNSSNIHSYSGVLAQIGESLSNNGDILLYGCNVAQGFEGRAFVTTFSNLTNADVAASIDLTGAAALGGNAILEASTGLIESATLDFAAYSAVLAPNTAPTFNVGTGKLQTDLGATDDTARDVVILPDGKFVVVGSAAGKLAIARYNTDGSLDTNYSSDGKVIGATGTVTGVVVQPDGQIAVAVDNGADFAVFRFSTTGSLSVSVTTDFPGIDVANDIALQVDGKLVVAGTSNNDFAVARYNTNGTLDTTFDIDGKQTTNGGATDQGAAVVLQADGKILVAGSSSVGISADFALVRYNTNGSLDTAFSGDGKRSFTFGAEDIATSLALQTDGKIVVGGYSNAGVDSTNDFALARLNTNGTLDTTFDTDGEVTTSFGADDRVNSIVIQSDGKIIAAGSHDDSTSNFALARYNTNGSLDTTFGGGDGLVSLTFGAAEFAYSVKLQADGKLLVIGDTNAGTTNGDTDFAIARLNADGSLDTTFSTDGRVKTDIGGAEEVARSVLIQLDGKIVVSGFGFFNSTLTRYNLDGSLDTTFSGDGKAYGGAFQGFTGLTLQGDGKIVVGSSDTGTEDLGFSRYNTDGSLDGTFTTSFGTDSTSVVDVTVQGDGKIVVAGTSQSNFAVARFNTDGALDTTFDTDGKVTTDMSGADRVAKVIMQSNGKILVAGYDAVGADANFAVARYNTNGSLDTTFGAGDGKTSESFGLEDKVTSMALQSNGKIVLAGFTDVNNATTGLYDFALMRLNTDGSLDTTFDTDGKVTTDHLSNSDIASSVAIQSDGKIIAAGSTGALNANFLVARYNTNGSLDTTFGGGDGLASLTFGAADFGSGVTLQADGKILVVGQTNTGPTGTDSDFAIARLNTDGSLDRTFDLSVSTLAGTTSFTEQSVTPVVIDSSVTITDAELAATNYGGAMLTLARRGGANAQDMFSATGALSPLIEGNTLVQSGLIIGGVVQNSEGVLLLSFNSNATQALMDQTLSSLAYLNTSNNPSASVQLDWTFNDGNSGAQGTGGALFTMGSKTINVTLINDAPTAPDSVTTYTNPDVTYAFSLSDFGFSDAEDGSLTAIRIDTIPFAGSLRFDGFNVATIGVEFTAAELLDGRLTFAPGASGGSFQYKVKDNGGLVNLAQSTMFVSTNGEVWNGTGGNDTHVSTILADTLNGLGGNDTVLGSAGDDTINGGAGVDTSQYSGFSGDYTITRNGLTTTVSGPDATDTLTSIELLQFSDLSVRTLEHAERDFGDDGMSDILWRNTDGSVLSWNMNGSAIASSPLLAGVTTDWKIADGSGDYNADSKSDILWRNDNGDVLGWLMDGATITANPLIASVTRDWRIADGAGDYNGDGKSDLLWRNDNGSVVTWLMDGGTIASSTFVAAVTADWKIADGSGDYNGDGKSDILWHNDNGTVLSWLMNGAAISSSAVVSGVTTDWKIADGSGDYNGDGKSDILWRNTSGTVLNWLMNGSAISSSAFVAGVTTDWKIADGSSDYSGDGKSDVLWRNDNGTVLTWTMDGSTISSAAVVASVTSDWQIQS